VNNHNLPILYSFRRCPYAIRARLALKVSNVQVEIREVSLKDKPKEMLLISPKATVPVLELVDGKVIDESRDIMLWALSFYDPENWLPNNFAEEQETNRLININDSEFKEYLDHYKYADRFPQYTMEYYRAQAEEFLKILEKNLNQTEYLIKDNITLVDMAILPFIRQFAYVDKEWFDHSNYKNLKIWLSNLLKLPLFEFIMQKSTPWTPESKIKIF